MSLLAYAPFMYPMPVQGYWYLLILPLCAAVTVVYKAIKCESMSQVPKEAAVIFVQIILGFAAAAAGLVVLVWAVGR